MKVDLEKLPKVSLQFIPPMLAKAVNQLPERGDWRYELKLDGYRAQVVKKRGRVTVFSRRGHKLNSRFPTIASAFEFLPDNTIIDGEIVVLDENGRPSFSELQNFKTVRHSVYFYAFDLLVYQGRDLRKLALDLRRGFLEENVLADRHGPVRLSEMFAVPPQVLVAAARESGLEGIVAKRAVSTYETGERSGAWLKYKTNKGQELVIGGYKPGPIGFEHLLVGYYEGKNLIFIAKVKNGFTPALRQEVAAQFKGLATTTCPFANLPEPQSARRGEALTARVMKKMRWLLPKLVAQVEFTEWTRENHLRHSKFIGLREDKRAQDVTREIAR